jgi:lysophospholipid acyltransferase
MYLISFITAFLSGWLLNNLHDIHIRKIFSTVVGIFIQMYMYRIGKINLPSTFSKFTDAIGFIPCMIFVVISYLVMNYYPRMQQHKVVFVVNALLLSLAHIHKMIYYSRFWGADVNSVMMMNLCRLTAISINYRDGGVPMPKDDKEDTLKPSKCSLLPYCFIGERAHAIAKIPSFFDYLGYMYYCGGTIAGPFYEYNDYINFIERTGHYSKIPSTFIPTIQRFITALSKSLISLIVLF